MQIPWPIQSWANMLASCKKQFCQGISVQARKKKACIFAGDADGDVEMGDGAVLKRSVMCLCCVCLCVLVCIDT